MPGLASGWRGVNIARAGITCRRAVPADAPTCVAIRGQTRDNAIKPAQLAALGITADTWAAAMHSGALAGHVAEQHGRVLGHCFGAVATGEVLVLAVLPEADGRGLGRQLLALVSADLLALGHTRLFLSASIDPAMRSHGFYRHLGWRPAGVVDSHGDETLEWWATATGACGPSP